MAAGETGIRFSETPVFPVLGVNFTLAHCSPHQCFLLQALNDFIDRKLQASPIKSLIVYPEGKHMCRVHACENHENLPSSKMVLYAVQQSIHPYSCVEVRL